jgi:hypothetical protein
MPLSILSYFVCLDFHKDGVVKKSVVFLQKVAFTGNLWNFKAISEHKNHFDVNLK